MALRKLIVFAPVVLSFWAETSIAQDPIDTPATVNVTVPVKISDVTRTVYGIRVECNLAAHDGTVVASGSTYLIAPEAYRTKRFEISLGTEITDDIMQSEIEGLNTDIIVTVAENKGRHIESWMLGHCQLHILYDLSASGTGEMQTPTLCAPAPEDENVAYCAWPGSTPVGYVEFNRAGLNPDGTPEALPGVD